MYMRLDARVNFLQGQQGAQLLPLFDRTFILNWLNVENFDTKTSSRQSNAIIDGIFVSIGFLLAHYLPSEWCIHHRSIRAQDVHTWVMPLGSLSRVLSTAIAVTRPDLVGRFAGTYVSPWSC